MTAWSVDTVLVLIFTQSSANYVEPYIFNPTEPGDVDVKNEIICNASFDDDEETSTDQCRRTTPLLSEI